LKILNQDCRQALREMSHVRMIFADPPDNINHKYNSYSDRVIDHLYRRFISEIIYESMQKCDVFWLSYNASHIWVGGLVDTFLANEPWKAKACVQTFTFGQHNHRDLGSNHRPLIRIMRKGTKLYPDAVRVPSWRQEHGDKRADPRGRVPGDHFDFPRVTGNSKQRRAWHSTQLHEGLYERCIKLCCKPGDTVCDLFAGSGTLARVAPRCGVDAILVEIDPMYCAKIAEEHGL